MRPLAIAVLLLMPALLCSGCHFGFPKVAKVAVQQGNVITQEMVDRLKPGMTRRQVAFVMGEPVVRDPFNPDRWDYVYSVQVGTVVYQQLRMSLFFENDTLAKFTGDMAPTTAAQNKAADAVADPLLEGPREDQITPPAG
ncbi:MAG TPA: outer membrane protein assembly factor BamE [Pseudomonadales bacterium]|nr:outer membrane protein assembly factor BamE [Pseudomonadales bacterium]